MEYIKNRFYEKTSKCITEYQKLKAEHGDKVLANVTIGQVLTGMKGIPALITDTSKLDANEGIRFRGFTLGELRAKLPRLDPQGEPLPEGLFYLMLLGEIPEDEDVANLSKDWATRAHVPQHVFDVIDAMPKTARPMTQFAAAIVSMATESVFQKAYRSGVHKKYYWDFMYDDVMNLIARLPRIAAYIYRRCYYKDKHIEPDPRLDWAGNLAHMMGHDTDEVKRLMRLYMVIHADHEGGNVSAHTTHLVGSALSNPYYSLGAGMLGLAGPLHGYANQDVINWIFELIEELGTEEPTKEQLAGYVQRTLQSGRVVPGYGHAVLRVTDPRFTAQKEFADKYIKDDKLVDLVNNLYEVVPPILGSIGKISNPWPNVDAYSGALLYHYGIKEHSFYTVLFGVSRAMGVLASLVMDRLYGLPIERPSSYPLSWFKEQAEKE
ncbi:citrate (Si)-synthase [Mangrovibacterium diazotrophicum]|uniref:citrate synthase (unknown stereospecificity) n=1 Tax=Mangrovibacterium diazotrophicum TaxID=1261403 RepID=A0A419W2H1_9BACT|nr:citrate (Si)-synthase [Mangrovibacterium diazotrophicum]RKD89686.1 citrate synthase [Mangrovibacterium diazotrophicum]